MPILTPLPPPGPGRTARIHELLKLVAVAGGIVVAVVGTSMAWVGALATDDELDKAVATHNLSATAHPRDGLRAEALERAVAELQSSRQETVELWRTVVGFSCADRESDTRLKAAAAAYCRDEFSARLAQRMQAPDAYREVVRTPWFGRPKLR